MEEIITYSKKDLKDTIPYLISKLELKSEFKQNPAYASSIYEIRKIIDIMGKDDINISFNVKENENQIVVEYTSSVTASNGSITIYSNCEEMGAYAIIEGLYNITKMGYPLRTRKTIQINSKLDNFNNIVINRTIYDLYEEENKINDIKSELYMENKIYDENGIMIDYVRKDIELDDENKLFELITPNKMISVSSDNNIIDKYSKSKEIQRVSLDTARVIYYDKDKDYTFSSIVKLDTNNLRNLKLKDSLKDTMKNDEIVIDKLSEEEIQFILNQEKNEIVRSGLSKWATKCNSYDSKQDELYCNTNSKTLA